MSTYLLVNLLSISVPLAYSFHKRLLFYKNWYAFWPAALISALPFLIWDIVFARWGVWGFTAAHTTGIELLSLPIEEWLFFVCIPYACVFTYASLNKLMPKDILAHAAKALGTGLAALLLLVGMLNLSKAYTSVTFISTGSFLLIHLFFLGSRYLGRFFFAFAVLLLPFLIVDGILTGSLIDGEVVWYNNSENLGIRIFTIPIEDFTYGFLLLLLNITLYEAMLAKHKERINA